MKLKLTSLVLGLSLLLDSVGFGSAQDYQKGIDATDRFLGDIENAISERV